MFECTRCGHDVPCNRYETVCHHCGLRFEGFYAPALSREDAAFQRNVDSALSMLAAMFGDVDAAHEWRDKAEAMDMVAQGAMDEASAELFSITEQLFEDGLS